MNSVEYDNKMMSGFAFSYFTDQEKLMSNKLMKVEIKPHRIYAANVLQKLCTVDLYTKSYQNKTMSGLASIYVTGHEN